MSCRGIPSRCTRSWSNLNRWLPGHAYCSRASEGNHMDGVIMTAILAALSENENGPSPAIPGIQFIDHVAIAVKQGDLDDQVKAYEMLGFREIHREEVRGKDQVREALLQIGDGPNLIQLLEPLGPESPVQKMIDKNGGRGGLAHIAFRVTNAQRTFDAMQAGGFRIIDKA